jgi:hypothetical protein
VSVWWLYALLDAAPAGAPAATGLAGEALRVVPVSTTLFAAIGALEATPAVSEEALRRHDAAVRALSGLAPAVLPARFGQGAASDEALLARVAARAPALARALEQVRGCEQMTLRAFGDPVERPAAADDAPDGTPVDDPALGPGARYLAARRRAQALAASTSTDVPELAPLLAALAPLVRATRVERPRAGAPTLLASVYHLVRRSDGAAYSALVAEHAPAVAPRRVSLSGPWPAYAFAP